MQVETNNTFVTNVTKRVRINNHEVKWIKAIFASHGNIEAIIFIRQYYDLDLKSSRKLFESLRSNW